MDRATALMRANAQRKAIAVLRARLVAGRITMVQALGDSVAEQLAVSRVIAWMPGWGPRRAERLLGDLGIWPNRRCEQLAARQRQAIEDHMR